MAWSLPGAWLRMLWIGSPASWVEVTCCGDSLLNRAFCSGLALASTRTENGSPSSSVKARYAWLGSRPVRAVISAASRAGIKPSLSVLQTPPSLRRNEAPALSSPPNPREPSNSPSANHLKPTGTSYRRRPRRLATRSIKPLLTTVLPTAASARHCGRFWNR
ncbi:hypothetical protein D3C72_1960630 [compost metagenome]